MMKRWLVISLAVFLLVTGCARFRGGQPEPPVVSTVVPVPATAETALEPPLQPSAAPTIAPTPDFASMNFVEENNLYLKFLAERQAEGADTSAAEEAYARSLDATLEGNSAQADQYLQQAILLLWNKQ